MSMLTGVKAVSNPRRYSSQFHLTLPSTTDGFTAAKPTGNTARRDGGPTISADGDLPDMRLLE